MELQKVIEARRTLKVMSDENILIRDIKSDVQKILEMGGKAPFHYIHPNSASKELKSLAPWRFYVLDGVSCRKLADYYIKNDIDGGKIIQMLRAAQTLIQVTWTPEIDGTNSEKVALQNIEHVAATAAAIQNMLLTATDLGYENYWSSGGTLRDVQFKSLLGIPEEEQLLGSIFIFDADTSSCKTKKGALKGRQGSVDDYTKQVVL
ncbi:nitroreductase family protein [Flavicella marina]|uniref:nitroreductase family protein n=1 Tax=Flavicella marina TaxID=1475951 RepID=UPI0012642B03|nr:nitroreductase family protein [Flavicella marina]